MPSKRPRASKPPALHAAAVALGRRGGARNSPKQNIARKQNAQRAAGRPGRVCSTCGQPCRGGHIDARLDATCGEHGWHWRQRQEPNHARDLLRDILATLTGQPSPADLRAIVERLRLVVGE